MDKPMLAHFGQINHILTHNYERYLPTAFDESMTLLQKVNKVIKELERLGEISNSVTERWNQVMQWILDDGISESVLAQLKLWNEDGTLANIINNELFGSINAELSEHGLDIDSIKKQINGENVYLGLEAGQFSKDNHTSGIDSGNYSNVAVGMYALLQNFRGWKNTVVGHSAMKDNKGGYNNVAIGDSALEHNIGENGQTGTSAIDTGSRNTALGSYALRYNKSGRGNVGVGRNAGHASESGDYNTSVGTNAYSGSVQDGNNDNPKTASYNTAIGYNALFYTNADDNIGIGYRPLYFNRLGVHNIAIGNSANIESVEGNRNISIGGSAMRVNANGSDNVVIGNETMRYVTSGNGNTAIGDNALRYDLEGNDLLTVNNSVAIGKQSRVSGDNQLQLGTSGITSYAYGAVQARSDERDKADIRETVHGLDFINDLRPVDFKWNYRDDYVEFYDEEVVTKVENEDGSIESKIELVTKTRKVKNDGSKKRSRYHHGFIAQDIQKWIEEKGIDFGGFQDHSKNGGEDILSIGHEELIAPLVKAVQELTARVKELESK